MEPALVPEEAKESNVTSVQEAIANEVKRKLENALQAIPEIVEESGEQLQRTGSFNAQFGVALCY